MKRTALLALTILLAACPAPSKKRPATASGTGGAMDPLDLMRGALKGMRTYRVRLVSTMDPTVLMDGEEASEAAAGKQKMTVTTELAVSLPDRMNQRVSMKNPEGELVVSLVFTGEKVRAASAINLPGKAGGQERAVKFDQAALAREGHPFDVGYNMRGHGLDEGEDLVGTLLAYLQRYQFTGPVSKEHNVGGEPCLLLIGRLDRERAMEMFFTRPRTVGGLVLAQRARDEADLPTVPGGGLVGAAARVIRRTAVLRLWISRKDHLPRRWTLGDGEVVLLDMRLEELDGAVRHPAGTFTISAEQLLAAQDITAQARAQLRQTEEAARDESTVRRVRAELEKLLD